jgi:hypothetical protein
MAVACRRTGASDVCPICHLARATRPLQTPWAKNSTGIDMQRSATQFLIPLYRHGHTVVPRVSRTYLTSRIRPQPVCPDTCATWRPPSDTIWRWGQTHGHMASHKYEIASLHVHTMRPRSTPLAAAASHPRSSRLASDLGAISVRSRCDLGAASRATSVLPRCDHRPPLAAPRARPSRGTRGSPRAP